MNKLQRYSMLHDCGLTRNIKSSTGGYVLFTDADKIIKQLEEKESKLIAALDDLIGSGFDKNVMPSDEIESYSECPYCKSELFRGLPHQPDCKVLAYRELIKG